MSVILESFEIMFNIYLRYKEMDIRGTTQGHLATYW